MRSVGMTQKASARCGDIPRSLGREPVGLLPPSTRKVERKDLFTLTIEMIEKVSEVLRDQ
jgi:hypothetical protein